MPTLDAPGIDWGTGPQRAGTGPGRGRRVNPVVLATLTFLAALVTTLLVLLLTGALRL